MSTRSWTYDEIVLALYAYCHVPFNKASNNNPWVIKIASIIGRTPAAVKMKIGNLGTFDPTLKEKGITGLTHTTKLDEQVWNDYYGKWEDLIINAEQLISHYAPSLTTEFLKIPEGTERFYQARIRLNQSFFRSCVLSSYNTKCCVTGISNPSLLEACHIVSWEENEELRVDPSNGLCLNALLHSAYDNFLMSVSPEFKIVFSDTFLNSFHDNDNALKEYFSRKNMTDIILPNRFYPNINCLEKHYKKFLNTYN